MRYYLLVPGKEGSRPYIEAVMAVVDAGTDAYLAADVSGYAEESLDYINRNGSVLSEDELRATPEGRRALRDWQMSDDSQLSDTVRRERHRDGRADVEMMARRGDPRARDLASRGFPVDEIEAFLRAEAGEKKPRLSIVR